METIAEYNESLEYQERRMNGWDEPECEWSDDLPW